MSRRDGLVAAIAPKNADHESSDVHPPYPTIEDFERMTDAEFLGYMDRIGFSERIRAAIAARESTR